MNKTFFQSPIQYLSSNKKFSNLRLKDNMTAVVVQGCYIWNSLGSIHFDSADITAMYYRSILKKKQLQTKKNLKLPADFMLL